MIKTVISRIGAAARALAGQSQTVCINIQGDVFDARQVRERILSAVLDEGRPRT